MTRRGEPTTIEITYGIKTYWENHLRMGNHRMGNHHIGSHYIGNHESHQP